MSKDLTRSFTHKTEITTAKPTLPISTGSTGMVSQERYNKALDSLEFHAKNSVLKDQQITQLRAVLGPAVEAAREREDIRKKGWLVKCRLCSNAAEVLIDGCGDSYFEPSNNNHVKCKNKHCHMRHNPIPDQLDTSAVDDCRYHWNKLNSDQEQDKALLAAGEILGLTEQSAEESEAG